MTTLQVEFTETELLTDPDIAEPLVFGGRRCHGGFDSSGKYLSPRSKFRDPAIRAWQQQHTEESGAPVLNAPIETWPEAYPSVAQTRFLLEKGIREPMVVILTRIGTVEGFGAMLRMATVENLSRYFDEDLHGTTTDHLERGLFEAHARDEAGWGSIAGHDQMWYAARDVAFENPVAEDQTAVMLQRLGIGSGEKSVDAETVEKQVAQLRRFPDLDFGVEMLLHRMVSLLFIEVQAFRTFAWAQEILSDPQLVAGEGEAGKLISYIRQDENPHVEYLKTSLSEMRERTFIFDSGKKVSGHRVIDELWQFHLENSLGDRHQDFLRTALREVERAVSARRDSADLLEEFHQLGTVRPGPDGVFREANGAAEADARGNPNGQTRRQTNGHGRKQQ